MGERDINDVLRNEGVDAARAMHDRGDGRSKRKEPRSSTMCARFCRASSSIPPSTRRSRMSYGSRTRT